MFFVNSFYRELKNRIYPIIRETLFRRRRQEDHEIFKRESAS